MNGATSYHPLITDYSSNWMSPELLLAICVYLYGIYAATCMYVEGEHDKYKLMIWASPQYIFMYGNTCYVTCVNTYKAVPVSHCGCLVGVRLMYVWNLN